MVDHPPRRQMKIKVTQAEVHRKEPVQEYIYHWDRIIGALAALLLLLGALGYGLYAWLTPSRLPAEAEIQDRQMPGERVDVGPPQRGEAASDAAPSLPERLSAMVPGRSPAETGAVDITDESVRKTPDAMRSTPEPPSGVHPKHSAMAPVEITRSPPSKITDSTGGVAERKVLEGSTPPEPAPKTRMPQTVRREAVPVFTPKLSASQSSNGGSGSLAQESPDEPASESSAADASEMPSGEMTDVASESGYGDVVADSRASGQRRGEVLLQSLNTSIVSPAVKRFLLAKAVIGNEPRGDLDEIALNDGGYAVVSSFSEVVGQAGETLQYRWLYEGKEVLRIRVPVGANRWRSHSTKRIYARMTGAWRAELLDSAGKPLASIDFTF